MNKDYDLEGGAEIMSQLIDRKITGGHFDNQIIFKIIF